MNLLKEEALVLETCAYGGHTRRLLIRLAEGLLVDVMGWVLVRLTSSTLALHRRMMLEVQRQKRWEVRKLLRVCKYGIRLLQVLVQRTITTRPSILAHPVAVLLLLCVSVRIESVFPLPNLSIFLIAVLVILIVVRP